MDQPVLPCLLMTMAYQSFLTVEMVAELYMLKKRQVRHMANEGLLPSIRCGRQFRFDPERLRIWAENGGAGGWRREGPHGTESAKSAEEVR
jgi:excisionase family DNA binding protein